MTVIITKSDNQKNEINEKTNTTSIDLGECEDKLKEEYHLPDNASFYLL